MKDHVDILRSGVARWNRFRDDNPEVIPDLTYVELSGANLEGVNLSQAELIGADLKDAHLVNANLSGANLEGADLGSANLFNARVDGGFLVEANLEACNLEGASLKEARLREAILTGARLRGADLRSAELIMVDGVGVDMGPGTRLQGGLRNDVPTDLSGARLWGARIPASNLTGAHLVEAQLHQANLCEADLRDAILRGADLRGAYLVEANCWSADFTRADLTGAHLIGAKLLNCNLTHAILSGCLVYGVSGWDLKLDGATQADLVISPPDRPKLTVDNLEVAQFIHVLLNNERIRGVIDTITAKAVLILGRFIEERKAVLDSLREALRQRDFVPIIFDFDRPRERDFTETIKTLAGLCRFVIVDITNPKSSPLELQAAVPDYMIPFVPILDKSEKPFSMFVDLQKKYDWVLDVLLYDSPANLVKALEPAILIPALEKSAELMARKAQILKTRDIADYLGDK